MTNTNTNTNIKTNLKYNHEKVLKHIATMEAEAHQFRMLSNSMERLNKKSMEQITKFMENKKEVISCFPDKDNKKCLDNFDFLLMEKDSNEQDMVWVRNRIDPWLQQQDTQAKSLKESARKLESKRNNKLLKQEEIREFMELLVRESIAHRKSCEAILSSLSQWKVRGNCALVEKLTSEMQAVRKTQKKGHS